MKVEELQELLSIVDTKLTVDMARLSSVSKQKRDLEAHVKDLREKARAEGSVVDETPDPIDFVIASNASAARLQSADVFERQVNGLQPAIDTAKADVKKSLAKKDVIETLIAQAKDQKQSY